MKIDPIKKWNRAADTLDRMGAGLESRYGRHKRELFSGARGRTLLVAAGTGSDFPFLPAGLDITAIDFAPKMVEKARKKAVQYAGKLEVMQADVQSLEFPDYYFETVLTSCTFCSVPDPLKGLGEIYRVLTPHGRLLMFEHVRPGNVLLGQMMDFMTLASRMVGPDMNRRTVDNVRKSGFQVSRVYNVYLDIVKMVEAFKE